ncbi:hypothetical protein HID58_069300 [Brassica napus]|uniref:RNase H type-1 domain-containing protein n=2 Tax=Brassica TaxID=3705 RepID=A0ABQ7YVM0_BRANA|nr:hypothetical protein HID58_069300 [Brassica napus]
MTSPTSIHTPVIRNTVQRWQRHLLELFALVLPISSNFSQRNSNVFHHLIPVGGFSSGNPRAWSVNILKSTVLSSTSHWERLYLPSSLWERSLLSSSLLVVRNIPASSLSMRGETSPVFKPVLCSSLLERVVKRSAFMALALAFRAFTDHSMVLGLKKAVFNSALLQISSYRSLEDWISLVEDVAAACVLSTASDIGFRSHNVFSDSLNLATLIISKELVHRCVIPLIL